MECVFNNEENLKDYIGGCRKVKENKVVNMTGYSMDRRMLDSGVEEPPINWWNYTLQAKCSYEKEGWTLFPDNKMSKWFRDAYHLGYFAQTILAIFGYKYYLWVPNHGLMNEDISNAFGLGLDRGFISGKSCLIRLYAYDAKHFRKVRFWESQSGVLFQRPPFREDESGYTIHEF